MAMKRRHAQRRHGKVTDSEAAASVTNGLSSGRRESSIGQWKVNYVHSADALAGLKNIPSNSFDVAVTSPPYWGQRGASGIGSEADPRAYIRNLVEILAETMRCLKPTGLLWLNIGDAYNTPINWRLEDHRYGGLGKPGVGLPPTNSAYSKDRGRRRAFIENDVGWLKYGNLLGIPYRAVLELTTRGFLFRGEVIWEKSRPLPEGRCRRPHRRHESIYLIAKDERHSFRTTPPVGSVWKLVQTPNLSPHCSTFPLDLPIKCIEASAVAGKGLVFDPFMGSGTTGRAALALGHEFLGFEIDPHNAELANSWISSGTLTRAGSEQEQVALPLL